jgi:nitrite reductase/ring-hydroxylating ferredoxin subunit
MQEMHMADHDPMLTLGQSRSPGPQLADYLASERRDVPDFVQAESYDFLGSAPLTADRYTSADFFNRETSEMWPKVWQFAARAEDMPEPGDVVVYENAGRSYLITRQEDGSIRAFHNVCLHRGRKLRTSSGATSQLQCPFHGFTWNLDGSLKQIPCQWDFGHLKESELGLPEVRVGEWAGYIFLNEDGKAPPLLEYLHPLPEHFARWEMERCFTALWVGKVIPANWKVTAEAFMEAWHSVVTHPQILPFTGDANSSYRIWGDHVNLALTPFAVLSPHLQNMGHDEQFIVDSFHQYSGRMGETLADVTVPDGKTAREVLGDINRQRYLTDLGYDGDAATDSELLDGWTYNVFPNFAPWGGFAPNIVYRWRPWPDQDHTLMEVRILARTPKDQPVPPGAPMHMIGADEPWSSVTAWGKLGSIFDQDMENLPYVQEGLKVSKNNLVELGNYQEIRIRHFHQTLDTYLAMKNR